ncbi:MAG: DNA polymerase III subunit beta [Candidatus Melainabacteria bacterium RIFCSPLOWO2_02_FULL_35_15]|nr:MAG: DNA polymerase III subunit beta [Candidatus Melainabacteria bacterium RIFCSPLOWO2_12_FULL_35_11]OGI13460.1 MAG: DNA polymerase III subunit beta [Candidatus Melainabacteria bacterium RIFCSPLOWO2_02_FULL_35_15]
MDIEVKTEQFKKVVSCASRATSNKAIQPILNNILLHSENGSLMVSATDLDLAIECKLPAEILKPGRITLPAKKLDEIVNKASGISVNISIDKNQLAKILSDKAKFQINGVSPDEFPEVISKQEEKPININQNELMRAISLTSFATSKFESTSILSGANFEINGNKFEIGATDGSRLARYTGNIGEDKEENDQRKSAVIPGRALAELEKLIDTFKDGNEFVSVYFLPGQVVFQNNDFSLSTRLVNGTFPEYDKLIPKEQSNKADFSRSELLAALERVAILANERTNVIKLTFEKGKKFAQLNSNSPDYGNATDEIEVEYTGNSVEIAFNYRYLTEVLRNLQTDRILLEMETSLSPILLKLSEKANYRYTYLIMPVQLR